jgi:hypothetical protein
MTDGIDASAFAGAGCARPGEREDGVEDTPAMTYSDDTITNAVAFTPLAAWQSPSCCSGITLRAGAIRRPVAASPDRLAVTIQVGNRLAPAR